jgi:hypothetical protein
VKAPDSIPLSVGPVVVTSFYKIKIIILGQTHASELNAFNLIASWSFIELRKINQLGMICSVGTICVGNINQFNLKKNSKSY